MLGFKPPLVHSDGVVSFATEGMWFRKLEASTLPLIPNCLQDILSYWAKPICFFPLFSMTIVMKVGKALGGTVIVTILNLMDSIIIDLVAMTALELFGHIGTRLTICSKKSKC